MRKALLAALTLTAASTATAQGALGPQGRYYLLDGDSQQGFIVQGLTSSLFQLAGRDYGVAVHGGGTLVRAYNTDGGFNHDYDAAGSLIGNSSPATFGFNSILDGGTDGRTNYGITCDNPGVSQVYSAGADWSSPTFMFNAPNAACGLALTYHSGRGTLFTSSGGNVIYEITLAGAVVNNFAASSATGHVAALAVDTDGSLWFFDNSGTGTLQNYTPSGGFVGSAVIGGAGVFGNVWGGEIGAVATVPEPATVATVATGLLLLGARAWRRRRSPA